MKMRKNIASNIEIGLQQPRHFVKHYLNVFQDEEVMDKSLRLLRKIRQRCHKQPEFKPLLAHCLGFGSTMAIDQWFNRVDIPYKHRTKIQELLDGRIKVTVS
ncbi:MAG: hypothetical protein DRI46_10455 [Chloroflexi bacterium]|nr:MAG: hypothetical protein DRI46_10455 [Chloroflexota bacterium]